MKRTREREPGQLVSQISSTMGQSVREVRRQAGPWPGREAAAQRGVLGLLVLGLVTGPIALGVGLVSIGRSNAPVASPAAPVDLSQDRQVVGAAAIRFLRAWWQATDKDRDGLDQLLVRGAAGAELPTTARAALVAVDVVSVEPYQAVAGGWRVRATVWPAGVAPADFEVLVRLVDGQTGILQLPSAVPRAVPAAVPHPQVEVLLADDPRTKAAAGFISSWLTGRDDVPRWTVPSWQPPPAGQVCTRIAPVRVSGDPATRAPHAQQTVTIQITCVTSAGGATALAYDLTLSWGSGQWAVAAINGSDGSSTEGKVR